MASFDSLLLKCIRYNKEMSEALKGTPKPKISSASYHHYGVILKDTYDLSPYIDHIQVNTMLRNAYLGGQQRHVLSAHLKLAFIDSLERALVNRLKTPIRALAHAAGRFLVQGGSKSLFMSIKKRIDDLEGR